MKKGEKEEIKQNSMSAKEFIEFIERLRKNFSTEILEDNGKYFIIKFIKPKYLLHRSTDQPFHH